MQIVLKCLFRALMQEKDFLQSGHFRPRSSVLWATACFLRLCNVILHIYIYIFIHFHWINNRGSQNYGSRGEYSLFIIPHYSLLIIFKHSFFMNLLFLLYVLLFHFFVVFNFSNSTSRSVIFSIISNILWVTSCLSAFVTLISFIMRKPAWFTPSIISLCF